jgi:hypothetical protein
MLTDRIEDYRPALILIREGRCFECPEGFSLYDILSSTGYFDAVIAPHYERIDNPRGGHYAFYRRRTETASSP